MGNMSSQKKMNDNVVMYTFGLYLYMKKVIKECASDYNWNHAKKV